MSFLEIFVMEVINKQGRVLLGAFLLGSCQISLAKVPEITSYKQLKEYMDSHPKDQDKYAWGREKLNCDEPLLPSAPYNVSTDFLESLDIGLIPNNCTALKIAMAVIEARYGSNVLKSIPGFEVNLLDGGIWEVKPKDVNENATDVVYTGGAQPYVYIDKFDGKIVRIVRQ